MDDIKQGPDATVFRAGDSPFEPVATNLHFAARDIGLGAVTGGAYTVKVFRALKSGDVAPDMHWHDADFQYVHILKGEIEFELEGGKRTRLSAGDSIYQPEGCRHCVTWLSDDLELLEIFSPAEIKIIRV